MLESDPGLIAMGEKPPGNAPVRAKNSVEIPWGSIGGTALHCAVKAGVHGMVKLLLDHGAEVNAESYPRKWTPLHDATYYTITRDLVQGEAIIRTLVLAGADLNARTWGGFRPLDVADYLNFRSRAADIFDLLSTLARGTRHD